MCCLNMNLVELRQSLTQYESFLGCRRGIEKVQLSLSTPSWHAGGAAV